MNLCWGHVRYYIILTFIENRQGNRHDFLDFRKPSSPLKPLAFKPEQVCLDRSVHFWNLPTLGIRVTHFLRCKGSMGDLAQYEHLVNILGWSEHWIRCKSFSGFRQNQDFWWRSMTSISKFNLHFQILFVILVEGHNWRLHAKFQPFISLRLFSDLEESKRNEV